MTTDLHTQITQHHEAHINKYKTTPIVSRGIAWTIFIGIIAVWVVATHPQVKVCGFLGAVVFALFEWAFRGVTGIIQYRARLSYESFIMVAYTTWEQWWMNVILCTPMMQGYYLLIRDYWMMVLLFPVFCFVAEIIGGYFLMHIWGKRGWFYEDTWALLHGNITLRYIPIWWVGGLIHVTASRFFYIPFSALVLEFLQISYQSAF